MTIDASQIEKHCGQVNVGGLVAVKSPSLQATPGRSGCAEAANTGLEVIYMNYINYTIINKY